MTVSCTCMIRLYTFFFFKQKTAYDMRISSRSSDVCSSDLRHQQIELHRDVMRLLALLDEGDDQRRVHRDEDRIGLVDRGEDVSGPVGTGAEEEPPGRSAAAQQQEHGHEDKNGDTHGRVAPEAA